MKRRFMARRNPQAEEWMRIYEEEVVYRALLSITFEGEPMKLRYADIERHWPMRFRRPALDRALARLWASGRVTKDGMAGPRRRVARNGYRWATWQAVPPADENTDAAVAA